MSLERQQAGDAMASAAIMISSDEQLASCCRQWAQGALLAVDTEFIRTDTFFPIAGLLQVCDSEQVYLIDPLAIQDFSPFAALLLDRSVVKVMHSCSEDLEVFDRLCGVYPDPIADTQIAAALAGYGFSLGYQKMVETLLGIHVPKGETRSDWLQRPLSASQCHYAALDVAYLPDIYYRLEQELSAKDRLSWWQQDCAQLALRASEGGEAQRYLQKFKQAWRLAPRQLAVLQALIVWREEKARQRNKPRGRILKDSACYELAAGVSGVLTHLPAVADLSVKQRNALSSQLLALINQAYADGATGIVPAVSAPLSSAQNHWVKQLQRRVQRLAEDLGVAVEMLARKRDLEELVRLRGQGERERLPASLLGWRADVVAEPLSDFLESIEHD